MQAHRNNEQRQVKRASNKEHLARLARLLLFFFPRYVHAREGAAADLVHSILSTKLSATDVNIGRGDRNWTVVPRHTEAAPQSLPANLLLRTNPEVEFSFFHEVLSCRRSNHSLESRPCSCDRQEILPLDEAFLYPCHSRTTRSSDGKSGIEFQEPQ
ncbi:hypothetical protein BDV96DRAFT_193440 [Lophiotrema nucula]|uniref:Uncharacterized protein n=1 Tax=Lophiotrema nucula TaxID=690887 RepID=A0A6A5YXU8_9PLEO|nr:hypothetical protein BDV96DRAFT_193440 [Lophiotrema nucula]